MLNYSTVTHFSLNWVLSCSIFHFQGILVHFDSASSKNVSVQFEAWFEIKHSFTLYDSNLVASRFVVRI